MNKKRLALLARYLDNVPARKFDLDHWVGTYSPEYPRDPGKENKCGTTACALGHAGYIPSFRRDGLQTILLDGEEIGEVVYGNFSGTMAAEAFFSLEEEEAEYLFLPENYGARSGPKTVAARIRRMIKEGGIPKRYQRKMQEAITW